MKLQELGNPLFRSWEKLSSVTSVIVGSGVLAISIAAYAATRDPWSLLLIPVGLVLATLFRLSNFVPVAVSISRERLTAEYLRPTRAITFSWQDISEIEVVRRRGGLTIPEFFSLWLFDDTGKKIRRLPLHISSSVLEEIRAFVESCQLPIHFERKERSFLLGP